MAFHIALHSIWTLTGSYLNFKDPQHKSTLKSFKLSELSRWEYFKFRSPPTGAKAPSSVQRGSLNTPVVSMSPQRFQNVVPATFILWLIFISIPPMSNGPLWFIKQPGCPNCGLSWVPPSGSLHATIHCWMKTYLWNISKVVRKSSSFSAPELSLESSSRN